MILTKYWQIHVQNMVYKVVLSNRAISDLDQTLNYLLQNWTVKDARNFLNKLEELKDILTKNPLLFANYDMERSIHKAVLTKHNIVFYQVDELNKIVHIITIFNVYQDPEKLNL